MNVVVFDLDDTLYLESEFAHSGFRHVDTELKRRGVTGFLDKAWERFSQGARSNMFNSVLPELGLQATPEQVAELVEIFRRHEPDIRLLPDAVWLLDRWAGGRILGLITDGFAVTQHNKIAALKLRGRVDHIVVSDDLGGRNFWKPSPAPYEAVMAEVGAQHSFTYVGDNPHKDFITARKLGWQTVRVRRIGGLHADVDLDSEHAAEHEVADLRALCSLIELPNGER
jgi:putative hydrolase of the HAD superfamily